MFPAEWAGKPMMLDTDLSEDVEGVAEQADLGQPPALPNEELAEVDQRLREVCGNLLLLL